MQQYPKFKFSVSDIYKTISTPWSEIETNKIIERIFQEWAESAGKVEDTNLQIRLFADLTEHAEGQSAVRVFALKFAERGVNSLAKCSFILRVHNGESAEDTVRRDKEIAARLASTGSEIFSGNLLNVEGVPQSLVVYRHAVDQVDNDTKPLQEQIIEILRSKDENALRQIKGQIEHLVNSLVQACDDISSQKLTVSGHDYFDRISDKIVPDIVIVANELISTQEERVTVLTEDGSKPDDRFIEPITLSQLAGFLREGSIPTSRWASANVLAVSDPRTHYDYVRLKDNDATAWLRSSVIGKKIKNGQQFELVVKPNELSMELGVSNLINLRYTDDACISRTDFELFCNNIDNISHTLRHNDLHTGNILCSKERLKVIDIGSLKMELPSIMVARLEVSIWSEVLKKIDIELGYVETILAKLSLNENVDKDDLSFEAWGLYQILLSLRKPATNIIGTQSIDTTETLLAYATQILFYQRYSLEKLEKVPPAFNSVARHWISRFKKVQLGKERENTPRGKEDKSILTRSIPVLSDGVASLLDLWKQALTIRDSDQIGYKSSLLLDDMVKSKGGFLQSPLTLLQDVIFKEHEEIRPFQSNRHVIISAPTSSGKSTVADMFLLGPAMLNSQRMCALYIAPTRALTQAKYRELMDLFSLNSSLSNEIVLSTGEDADDDWRINHGHFRIACMVYEKANILFSQNRRLLDRWLGCVVVDEMHMLADIERGPILEMALTKILEERRKIDDNSDRNPNNEKIRVVAITTEDVPDTALTNFLSITDWNTNKSIAPISLRDTHRPILVRHHLVLPGNYEQPYAKIKFIEFSSTSDRLLKQSDVFEVEKQLHNSSGKHLVEQHKSRLQQTIKLGQCLESLLLDLLVDNPMGYRVLVFVPGRLQAEEQAGRLRNAIDKRSTGTPFQILSEKLRHIDIEERLRNLLDTAEDKRQAETLRSCVSRGIFIHHSDINKKIRREIESICSSISIDTASQVVFATETLSYGINLAIHDVIMYGVEFNSQTRFREAQRIPLSVCQYHNMVGRAGRLGKTDGVANVYILAPNDSNPMSIVQDYYTKIDPTECALFVSADKSVLHTYANNPFMILARDTQNDECSDYTAIGAKDISYPFVRSVLDALRHLNLSDINQRVAVKELDLHKLFGSTFYACQRFSNRNSDESDNHMIKEETRLFRCAVRRILDDCTRESLGLVEVDEGDTRLFMITPRGEAIIDTGTEIGTVESLLTIVNKLQSIWGKCYSKRTLPAELYLVCLISQQEVLRQYINYAPECKGRGQTKLWPDSVADDNRTQVFSDFQNSLERIGVSANSNLNDFAFELRRLLDDWEPLRQIRSAYTGGSTDSVLRFFNAMISWINLDESLLVYGKIEGTQLPDHFRSRIQGFTQFTEMLHFKTVFLAKMFATETRTVDHASRSRERNLHLLASRLRLGCTSEAIPLFWPFSSDASRSSAAKLLQNDIRPQQILTMSDLDQITQVTRGIAPKQLKELREDLEKFVLKEISELAAEMTLIPSADSRRERVHRLWGEIVTRFRSAIENYRLTDSQNGVDFDDLLKGILSFDDEYETRPSMTNIELSGTSVSSGNSRLTIRVEIDPTENGTQWIGYEVLPPSLDDGKLFSNRDKPNLMGSRKYKMRFIGTEFRADWKVRVDAIGWIPFAELLKKHRREPYLVIVPFPWLASWTEIPPDALDIIEQRQRSGELHTIIMTPAAFAAVVTSLVRDFLDGEDFFSALCEQIPDETGFSVFGVHDVQELLDMSSSPHPVVPTIREKLLRHFEVGA